MKVRAIAIATERSNAIGTVELECTPVGLAIAFLGVASFQTDYAPAALLSGARLVVPWSGVREARSEGDQVFLALDPALTPHNRMTLVNFSSGDTVHHREVYRQRLVLRLVAVAGALLSVLIALSMLPRLSSPAAAGTAIATGAVAAAIVLVVAFAADRRIARGGLDADAAQAGFALELGMYLPTLVRSAAAPLKPKKPLTIPTFQGLLPRTTLAVVITLSASLLGAVLMARWMISSERRVAETRIKESDDRPLRLADQRPAPPISVRSVATGTRPHRAATAPVASAKGASSESGPTVRLGDACRCDRADSLLWEQPIPRLSILLISSTVRQKRSRRLLELEIGVVNNGSDNIKELELTVQFYERDPAPSDRRHWTENRALYFAGPLVPGQAIKWAVDAEGTEFEIDNPIPGDIGPGGDGAAPIERFVELLGANHRPVRMHGALMLTYLGDPRAREAVLKLQDALREDEAAYLRRLLVAMNEVKACRFSVDGSGLERRVQACIYNASGEPKKDLGFKIFGLEDQVSHSFPVRPPPVILHDAVFAVPTDLAPKTGTTVNASLRIEEADGKLPTAFEIVADRKDLLP